MNRILTLLVIILFALGCNTQSNSIEIGEFTQKYIDSLATRLPKAIIKTLDDSTIVVKYMGKDIKVYMSNAFIEYKSDPDSLQKILHKRVNITTEIFSPKPKVDISRIVPIIKPIEYLDELKLEAATMGSGKDVEGVYEKYNDQLIIEYAEDTQNSIYYLTHDDIKALSINTDSLKTIAIRNLDKLLTSIQRKGNEDISMLTAGGNYEASIILLPDVLNKKAIPVKGELVIAVPNRDVLLVTGSNNPKGIAKVKETAEKLFETGNYNISKYLYKWNGKIFEKFE